MTQTGGGCRASNYIHLLRKALQKDGLEYIPVISINLSGLETESSGFQITLPMIRQILLPRSYTAICSCCWTTRSSLMRCEQGAERSACYPAGSTKLDRTVQAGTRLFPKGKWSVIWMKIANDPLQPSP